MGSWGSELIPFLLGRGCLRADANPLPGEDPEVPRYTQRAPAPRRRPAWLRGAEREQGRLPGRPPPCLPHALSGDART